MKLSTKEMALYGMLGAVMFASKILMEGIPNVHLLGVFTVAFTVVYRMKALYIIYTFIFIEGVYAGFNTWWVPYLYLWAVLWGVTMLLPKKLPRSVAPAAYMVTCSLHGFFYGTLYAPFQAIAFGLSFKGMIAWIMAGLPWDIVHGISNFCCGLLICPIIAFMKKMNAMMKIFPGKKVEQ